MAWLRDTSVTIHVVVDPSTSAGLAGLAGRTGADLIVVDSQADTAAGRVALDGGTRGRRGDARGSVPVLPRGTPLVF